MSDYKKRQRAAEAAGKGKVIWTSCIVDENGYKHQVQGTRVLKNKDRRTKLEKKADKRAAARARRAA